MSVRLAMVQLYSSIWTGPSADTAASSNSFGCCGSREQAVAEVTRAGHTHEQLSQLPHNRLDTHYDAALVMASLRMAAAILGCQVDGVIVHRDRGSEYTAVKTADNCRVLGVVQSKDRVGFALGNAATEAFDSTLKVGFVQRRRLATRAEVWIRAATTWHRGCFHNSRGLTTLHQAFLSPPRSRIWCSGRTHLRHHRN